VITTLLIFHGICAVILLGALTHQALSVWWPVSAGQRSLFASFRAVRGAHYTNTIVVLFCLTALMGATLYPFYRLAVRVVLEDLRLNVANGMFELKEHLIAIGLGLLPAYWYFWKLPPTVHAGTRRALTGILALIVWWAFITGHVLNNIRGFGS